MPTEHLRFLELNFDPLVKEKLPVLHLGEKVGFSPELGDELVAMRGGMGVPFAALSKRLSERRVEL
jgi:hypothetical protein